MDGMEASLHPPATLPLSFANCGASMSAVPCTHFERKEQPTLLRSHPKPISSSAIAFLEPPFGRELPVCSAKIHTCGEEEDGSRATGAKTPRYFNPCRGIILKCLTILDNPCSFRGGWPVPDPTPTCPSCCRRGSRSTPQSLIRPRGGSSAPHVALEPHRPARSRRGCFSSSFVSSSAHGLPSSILELSNRSSWFVVISTCD